MGFDVVKDVIQSLRDARLQVGTLALRWRGEPLLHPEIEPILQFLYGTAEHGIFGTLLIETDGRFLTESIADFSQRSVSQVWVIDHDRGNGQGFELLQQRRGPTTRLVVKTAVTEHTNATQLCEKYPTFTPVCGVFPPQGDALWFTRTDHDHYLANANAQRQLNRIARELNVAADPGDESKPRKCQAAWKTPTISWDGKVTLCPSDQRLQNRIGEVTERAFHEIWREDILQADRTASESRGVPDRDLCRNCPMPWSPNRP